MSLPPATRKFDEHPSYTGGCTVKIGKYVFEFANDHPGCNAWGYVPQHRLVAEHSIGRLLLPGEIVHHKDRDPLNNHPENLQVMTQSDHRKLHARELAEEQKARLTEEMVHEALQGRSLKDAAAFLHIHTQTIRNRFPDLVAPRKRKSPVRIDDPEIVALIRIVGPDPKLGLKDISSRYRISARTVGRICEREGIPWVKKSKKGEIHRTYRRRKPIPTASGGHESPNGSDGQGIAPMNPIPSP